MILMKIFSKLILTISLLLGAAAIAQGQNIAASQYNLYAGHPKSLTVTNGQGTVTTTFDREGRVTGARQGAVRMEYDWESEPGKAIVSIYRGIDFADSGEIEIRKFEKNELCYVISGNVEVDVRFRKNGAVDTMTMTNPQISNVMTYIYHSEEDMFPYAIENRQGDQLMRMEITVDATDSLGNPTEYTQKFMGNTDVSRLTIEYYPD